LLFKGGDNWGRACNKGRLRKVDEAGRAAGIKARSKKDHPCF